MRDDLSFAYNTGNQYDAYNKNHQYNLGCYCTGGPATKWQYEMMLLSESDSDYAASVFKPCVIWKEGPEGNYSEHCMARFWHERINPLNAESPGILLCFLYFPEFLPVGFTHWDIDAATNGLRLSAASESRPRPAPAPAPAPAPTPEITPPPDDIPIPTAPTL